MAKAGYSITTEVAASLTGGTARSLLGVISPAQFGCDMKKFRIGFDGVTASAVPVLVELCYSTQASNSVAGTNSTAVTVNQTYGRTITAGFTGGARWTIEPTVLTVIDSWLLSPNGGLVLYDFPLGDTPDSAVSNGFVLRCLAAANVNARATMWFERC